MRLLHFQVLILCLFFFITLFTYEHLSFAVAEDDIISSNETIIDSNFGIGLLNRSCFPFRFVFGTASSAYQYEGAANDDGKGPSIWDTFTHKFPQRIEDGKNGDQATDSYHRYKEDVQNMKELGVSAYRFSISWSRVLPNGKLSKGVNQKGLAYYHNLINELLANGIQPFVTLFHWDLPQPLQDEYGGFLSPSIVDDFRDYVDLCFREFGNKVKHWVTLNEPWTYSTNVNTVAVFSSKQCPQSSPQDCKFDLGTYFYLAAHNQLLSHAAAVQIYRQKYQRFQRGIIGIVLNSNYFIPLSQTRQDQDAALRALDFMFGWYMDPITYGDYPRTMRSLIGDRLPRFSWEQSRMLRGSFDFLGVNYYSSSYAAHAPKSGNDESPNYATDAQLSITMERNGVPIGPKAASDWLYIYPRGIYDLLLHIKRRYRNPLIYITENGVDEANDAKLSLEEALNDKMRIQYYHSHLAYVQLAMRSAVRIKGYFAWSLLDNFEWAAGYTVRFGIYYVDYNNGLKRYPKQSVQWFKNFLRKFP